MKAGYYGSEFKSSTAVVSSSVDSDGTYYLIYTTSNSLTYTLRNSSGGLIRTSSVSDDISGGSSTPVPSVTVDLSGVIDILEFCASCLSGIDYDVYNYFPRFYEYLRHLQDTSVELLVSIRNIEWDTQGIVEYTGEIVDSLDDVVFAFDAANTFLNSIDNGVHSISDNVFTLVTSVSDISTYTDNIAQVASGISGQLSDVVSNTSISRVTLLSIDDKLDVLSQMDSEISLANSSLGDIHNTLISMSDVNGVLGAIVANTYAIRTKLDDLTVTSDFSDANIVSAINNLSSMFSLGETQTFEVGMMGGVSAERGSAQAVSVSCSDDTGYVLFSELGVILPNVGSVHFSECAIGQTIDLDCLGYYVLESCDSLTYQVSLSDDSFSGTLSLFDASGNVISLNPGDLIRPSASVNHWEVVRASGGVVGISDCVGLDKGLRFEDIFPRCALVPVRDLISAPSLFTSYCYQVGYNQHSFAGCSVLNVSGSPLTVEYVSPSPLLNWFANRQDDFRYWLDSKLDGLSVGSSADLVSLQDKLDSIESTLSSATYFAPVVNSVDAVGVNVTDLSTNFNVNIRSLLDKLDVIIEGSSESIENRINVNVSTDNDAYNVFYVTGEDGETQSVTEFTGDLTTASGRLLSLLYRLVFSDALSTVDDDLNGFEDFFTSQEQTES
ncbi:MAG: hypothetical protein ACI4TD_07760, partial [Phocaeicola sp.]